MEQKDNPKAPTFHQDTIFKFINLNKDLGFPYDEEYCQTVAKAYAIDRNLFAKTISTLNNDDIVQISKHIAYSNKASSNTISQETNTCISMSCIALTARESEVLNILNTEISKATSSSIIETKEEQAISSQKGTSIAKNPSTVTIRSTQVPTIGTISYSSSPLEVGSPETLNVNLSESSATGITRTYQVDIYCSRNGTQYFKTGKSVSIPAGSSSTTASFNLSFSSTGPMYTIVKVYTGYAGQLLTSRQGSNPDNVYGRWNISVSLPANRNYKGTLTLYGADGTQFQSNECLGRSVSNASMTTTNGNTPTGTYTGYLYGPMSDTNAYGSNKVVNMTGVSGTIITSGRSGIWIHAGRYTCADWGMGTTSSTYYPLSPTYGCVRFSPTNQNNLVTNITNLINNCHYTTGNISISQY